MTVRLLNGVSRTRLDPALEFKSLEEIFAGYAAVAPLALALYRTAEAKHLREASMFRPVLDLGCGSGEFVQLALRGAVDLGLDVSWQRLSRCPQGVGHRQLCLGDACRMSFADAEFQTVLSVSVLEHLSQPQKALVEVRRVLKPGGHFIGTAALVDLHEQLFYPCLLAPFRSARLARLYVRLHDRLFAHRCLLSQSQWEGMFAASGLELLVSRKIVSPRLTRYFDLLLPFAWAYRVLPRWAYSFLCRPPGVRALVQKMLLPLCYAEESDGSSLFFVARKPEESP
jgi:SAM-dependent methyltransferase